MIAKRPSAAEVLGITLEAVAHGDLGARANLKHGSRRLQSFGRELDAFLDHNERRAVRQQTFVFDAAHQLRNPLAGLRLAVDHLGYQLEDETAQRAYAEVLEQIDQMTELFEALLVASGPSSAQQVAVRPCDVSTRHEATWREKVEAAGIRFRIGPMARTEVREPPGGLSGLVEELIANTIRLSEAQRVEIFSEISGDRVLFHVRDNGVGIPIEERGLAVTRSWRSRRHKHIAGTGLGLSIVAELLGEIGGELVLATTPGGGLDAILLLPRM